MTVWCVPCVEPRLAQTLLRRLPDRPWDWVDRLVFVTHEGRAIGNNGTDHNVSDRFGKLTYMAGQKPHWPITVLDRGDVWDAAREQYRSLGLHATQRMGEYIQSGLGIKLLLPAVFGEHAVLVTDDDIALEADFGELLPSLAPFASQRQYSLGFKGLVEPALPALTYLNPNLKWVDRKQWSEAALYYVPALHKDAWSTHVVKLFALLDSQGYRGPKREMDQLAVSSYVRLLDGFFLEPPAYRAWTSWNRAGVGGDLVTHWGVGKLKYAAAEVLERFPLTIAGKHFGWEKSTDGAEQFYFMSHGRHPAHT